MRLRNIFNVVAPWACSLITTLYTYRPIFQGKLFGDPFDARLQMVLHEHWWRFLTGQTSLRNVEFFYPFEKGLGFSDVFLVHGLVHSIFRFLGIGMENSWSFTTIILIIIGNIGWVVVAKKILRSQLYRILFIILSNISLTFYIHFTYQANTVGYSYLSWVIVLIMHMHTRVRNNPDKINYYLIYLIISILIFALSCWYEVFFLIMTSVFFLFVSILKSSNRVRVVKNIRLFINNFDIKPWLIFSPAYLGLIFLFIYIYIPVQGSPDRPILEMLDGSPKLTDIFNAARVDQAVFGEIYKYLDLDVSLERRMGMGLVLPILSIALALFLILKNKKFDLEFRIFCAIIMTYIYFLSITEDFSIHKLFFENVIGFNSIRYPFRYVIFLSYVLILLLFIISDKLIINKKGKLIVFLIAVLLFVDQYRTEWMGWRYNELQNSDLLAFSDEVKNNCDYFYYDAPGGWWYDQIEAMTFAYQIGVPTVNGYSGGYPKKYPSRDFRDSTYTPAIFNWISQIPGAKRGCFLTGKTPIYFLGNDTTRVDLVGFKENSNALVSATSPYPYLFIYSNRTGKYELSFNIKSSECQTTNEIFIKLEPETDSKRLQVGTKVQKVKFELNVDESRVRRLVFSTDQKECKNDEISSYFNLSEIKIEKI